MLDSASERGITLPDGRKLCYEEYGAPDGVPVMYFHGSPGSRLEAALFDERARELGVRIVGPDRPGYGCSDFQPHRRFEDWPADVATLADALGIQKFAVMGLSGGGPHVLACTAGLGDRLTAAIVASGAGPVDAYIARSPSRVGRWLRRAGMPGTRLFFGVMLRLLPIALRRASAKRMSTWVDRRVLARLDVRVAFRDDLLEAFRNGSRGARHEYGLHTRSWSFSCGDVRMPVHLWHGDADVIVPVDIARYLADRLPDCRPRWQAGEGHLLIVDHIDEMLRLVRQAADAASALAPPRTAGASA